VEKLCAGWRFGGVKVFLFSVFFPVRYVSSVSPRFFFMRHAFCFLPLATILESRPRGYFWKCKEMILMYITTNRHNFSFTWLQDICNCPVKIRVWEMRSGLESGALYIIVIIIIIIVYQGYSVTFIKILPIYHSWIHTLCHSSLSSLLQSTRYVKAMWRNKGPNKTSFSQFRAGSRVGV
jgi:hypothetical protein